MPEIIIEDCGKYKQLYNLPKDINVVVCIGGRGGRKTYEVSKFTAKSVAVNKKRCVIVRDERELIRESILNDILNRYDAANEYGHFDSIIERSDNGLKDKNTGEMLLFTKGFRASDLQKKANLKGASNIDIAVIEEAEDIRDVTKFNTFHDSLRKDGSLVIIILNTPDINHWIVKRYFNFEPVKEHDGYFSLIPKKIKGFLCIQSNYKDNPYLPERVVEQYEGYGNPSHHSYDEHYYLTAIKGYASTGRKGQVLRKVKLISLADYLALPYKEIFGQDFGTASPAGLVGVKIHRNQCWCREINYKPMPSIDIGKMYCNLNFDLNDEIIADHADKQACTKLGKGFRPDELKEEDVINYPQLLHGWNVRECIKGTDSVRNGINLMTGMELFAVSESKNLWDEIAKYIYAQDKNMNYTDDPIDEFNHLIDPWRYVVTWVKRGNFVASVGV